MLSSLICGAFPSSLGIKKEKWPNNFIATDTSPKVFKIAKSFDCTKLLI